VIAEAVLELAQLEREARAELERRELHRQQMHRTDTLLNRLERLNLSGMKKVPEKLRRDLNAFYKELGVTFARPDVQPAMDQLYNVQEALMGSGSWPDNDDEPDILVPE
jgi:hypothetical protein